MKTQISLLFVAMALIFSAAAQEITFEKSNWEEIKAKAKKQNKLIFLDAYTTWCGPCKAIAKKTFTDEAVAKYFNANFINAKIDMEKGEGIELAKTYEVKCYPNLLFIDGDGKLVHRGSGFKEPKDFIALAEQTKTPEATFAAEQKQFAAGNVYGAFVNGYLKSLASNCLPTSEAAAKYFATVPETQMINPFHWQLIRDYITDVYSPPFTYLVSHRNDFIAKYTADSINNKIYAGYRNHSNVLIRKEKADQEKMDKLKREIASIGFPRAEELNLNIDFTFFETKGMWEDYFNVGKELAEKYNMGDSDFLNNFSWQIYEKINDKNKLDLAVEWAKKSVELKEDGYNLDTYANLLYKTGNRNLAIEKEKRAIELAKAGSLDTKDLEVTLSRFQAGK